MKNFNSEEMCPLCVHDPECDKLAEEVAKDGNCLPHCGGQNFEDKRELVSYRELDKWLATGQGEMREKGTDIIRTSLFAGYHVGSEKIPVQNILVRKWNDTEWHEPTKEYCYVFRK
jgi:hypothetical protein